MLSLSLSFRRPAFLGVAAPLIAVIFSFTREAHAQPTAPASKPGDVVVAQAPPTPPPSMAPVYVPAPPGATPQPWAPQPPQWGPQPWGAQQPPGYWPQYVPATPPSASFYPPQEPFSLPPPTPKEPAHRALMTVGILASIGGVATLITGSILMSVAKERIDVYRDGPTYCCAIDDAPLRNAGIALLVTGGITAAIGIPLWMIGGRRVPVRKTTQAPAPTAPPQAPASTAPLLRVGLSGASVSWQF